MLKFFLSTRPIYHIIAVTETKLDPKLDASSIVHLDNYVLLRRDRKKGGGGVALFFHNSICHPQSAHAQAYSTLIFIS